MEQERALLKAYIKSCTEKFTDLFYAPKDEPEDDRPEAVKRIETYLRDGSGFGGYQEEVARLMSALLGHEVKVLEKSARKIDWSDYPWVAVVPTGNDNSHDYPIGETSVIWNSSYGIRPDGTGGNHMTENLVCMRPATAEEIEATVADWPDRTVGRIVLPLSVIATYSE
jgi:hypothetical protein